MPRAVIPANLVALQQAQRINAAVRDAQSAVQVVAVDVVALQGTTAGLDVTDVNAKLADYDARLTAGGL